MVEDTARNPLAELPQPVRDASKLAVLVVVGALASIAAVAWFFSGKVLSLDALIARRADIVGFVMLNPVSAPLLYIVAYALVAALSIPGATLMTVAGGFLFGGPFGGALAAFAATIGATCLFISMRAALGPAAAERFGPRLQSASRALGSAEASYLLFARLAPVLPFWLVNIAAALSPAHLTTFVWTTLVGIIPVTFFVAVAGSRIDAVFSAEITRFENCVASGSVACHLSLSPSTFMSTNFLLGACALAGAALAPVAVKYARRKRHG